MTVAPLTGARDPQRENVVRRNHHRGIGPQEDSPSERLLRRVLAQLDLQNSNPEIVRVAASEICHHLGAHVAQLYLVDARGECLEHAGVWDWDRGTRYRSTGADTGPLRRGEGLPGRVWLDREPGFTSDLQLEVESGRDPRRHPLDARTAIAFPLLAGAAVIGVLELWLPEVLSVDRELLDDVYPAVRVLGATLGRLRAEERLADLADRSFVVILRRGESEARGVAALEAFPIAFASPSFSRITGYGAAELLDLHLGSLMGPETGPGTATDLARALKRGDRITADFIACRKDGTSFPLRLEISPVLDDDGTPTHFVAMPPEAAEAVGGVKRGETDPLTGLPNRLVLNNAVRRSLERAKRTRDYHFAVLFVDLDGFKAINDRLGHMVGDQLLAAVARQLEGAVRPGDIVARYGGDEFVILLEIVGGMQPVLAVADRIGERLGRAIRVGGHDVRISASIGVALSDNDHRSVEDILTEADAAMYLAKQAGGGRYRIFDMALQEAAIATQRLRTALKSSLERGEFRLHYQPMVELASDGIAGMEALLRWHHPDRGVLPAGEFIAEAEEMGLILPIGRWVIQEACRQVRAWQDELPEGIPLVLSVNLSSRELLDPGLAEWLAKSIEETGANPRSLRFELPEDFFARPRSEARAALQPLLDLGIRFAIGDFGRGYASMGHLHRLPVDCIKIDRQFVADLPEWKSAEEKSDVSRAVLTILALAESLGIPVAASGVETSEQRRLLEQMSCHYAQGNLFSKPVDGARAALLMHRAWGGGRGAFDGSADRDW